MAEGIEVFQAPSRLIAEREGINFDMPVVAYAGFDNGLLVATFGLAWGGGRCWAWFRTLSSKPAYVFHVTRWAKKLKRQAVQLGESELFTPRDNEFATSARLLRLLGFRLHSMHDGIEIHVCSLNGEG